MRSKVSALIFVGDACEESCDALVQPAADLGRLGVPVFLFQEGHNQKAEQVFREIAQLTRGAHCRFDPNSARQLAELLRAVSLFAVGGSPALVGCQDAGAIRLLGRLPRGGAQLKSTP
jgi:hypothetical protein